MKTDTQDNLAANYVTTREAARRIGVSLRTAQLWVETGKLDAWKTAGGHRRISVASIERVRTAMAPAAAAPTSDEPAPTERLRILLVEDDDILLRFYKLAIARWNLPVDVDCASNGYDALLTIGHNSPDLMVSDLRMPGLDGFQMIRSLAGSPFREGMRIVVVSSLTPDEIEAAGGLPADVRRFAKPAPMAVLRTIVAEMLARRQAIGASA